MTSIPQLPVLKVELPKLGNLTKQPASSRKAEESEASETPATSLTHNSANNSLAGNQHEKEDADSRSSPAVLLDPVTGILEPVKKVFEPTAVIQGNNSTPHIVKTPAISSALPPPAPASTTASVIANTPTVITTATPSVISAPVFDGTHDIPNISERIHQSTTAVKLKTGKGLINLDSLDHKPMTFDTSAIAKPVEPITPATPLTPAVSSATTSQSQDVIVVGSKFAKYSPPFTSTQAIQQPRSDIRSVDDKPSFAVVTQWQPKIGSSEKAVVVTSGKTAVVTSCNTFQSPQVTSVLQSPVTHERIHLPKPDSNAKVESHHDMQQQPMSMPSSLHSKLPIDTKPSPSSLFATVGSSEPLRAAPEGIMSQAMKHESLIVSGKNAVNKSIASGLQIAGYPTPAVEGALHISSTPNLTNMQTSSGVIAELLQHQSPHLIQQHQKELSSYMSAHSRSSTPAMSREGVDREREREAAAVHAATRSTPPSSSTPPTSLGQLGPLGLHLRSGQPSIIVPPPSHAHPFHPDLSYEQMLRQQMLYMHSPHYQDQARAAAAMGIPPPRFGYPSPFPLPLSTGHGKAPENLSKEALRHEEQQRAMQQHREQNKTSKPKNESSGREPSKMGPQELRVVTDDSELKRHDMMGAMQPPPHLAGLRIPQGIQFASPSIRQFTPHLLSPHERYTDSPAMLHYGQNKNLPPQHVLPPQIRADEIKQQEMMRGSPFAKQEERKQFVSGDLGALHRQQLSIPVGSPAPGFIEGRPLQQPAHSPGALQYRKEATRSPMAPPNDTDLHRKPGRPPSSSYQTNKELPPPPPSPQALNMSHGVLPSHHMGLPSHHGHHAPPPDNHVRRIMQPLAHMGSEAPIHVPPPAHALLQPMHPLPQTPPHGSQVPPGELLLRYPILWQGLLALKNDQAAVQMQFISGNMQIAQASLPPLTDGGPPPLRIAQRMRLEQTQLEGVARKMQVCAACYFLLPSSLAP